MGMVELIFLLIQMIVALALLGAVGAILVAVPFFIRALETANSSIKYAASTKQSTQPRHP